ncbi:RNA 2',3'-cyclic phosphodiesterase [Streptomyces zagrosensis]|uniref:RNA 2',3'-cyclic phosphodiesterase n=1 Tax=Streptomyces zagrosensis TaxID=1042984 RepID=A0A7W9Q6M6_9ACTN|nr:RNA 2',3'-cyclic phosphodiesterase [Streptomyces zagrosensis]MBB5934628.1 2'-5' RNA ligase [Streptomyces zagrosensis]
MRLFAAVLPPPAATVELAAAVAPLHALPGADQLTWTGRAGWHFTLAFYGEVEPETLPELYTRLGRAAHRNGAFQLRLKGGGTFSNRVLWAGASGGLPPMRRLAESAAAAGRRAGVSMEQHRVYTPHLTIARNRTDIDLAPYAAALATFEGQAWRAGELSLVRSNPPQPGVPGARPRYDTLTSWPLGE